MRGRTGLLLLLTVQFVEIARRTKEITDKVGVVASARFISETLHR